METLLLWANAHTAGLPRWGWALMVFCALAEKFMGQSKDPRWRSIADSIRHLLGMAIGMLPGSGPVLRILQTIYVIPKVPTVEPALVPGHVAADEPPPAVPPPIPPAGK